MKSSTELYNALLIAFDNKESNILKGLHGRCVSNMLGQAEKIYRAKHLIETVKINQMLIMLEGFVSYFVQFGFDHELIGCTINFYNTYINSDKLLSNKSMQAFKKNINNSTLFFAVVDGLLTPDLVRQANLNFENALPWEVIDFPEDQEVKIELLTPNKYNSSLKMSPIIPGSYFSPALNSTGGFILSRLDKYTEAFIKFALKEGGAVMNIGSGYGVPERLALNLGAEKVICNDISKEQLELIADLTPMQFKGRLEVVSGSFPDGIKIVEKSIRVLGMFRVLHFFDPEILVKAIKAAYQLLEPGGVLILSAETPFLRNWEKFIPEYKENIKSGNPWPGFIADTVKYETAGFSKKLPPSMHFLDVDVVTRVLEENGFSIELCAVFDRTGYFPKEILLNGKESVGAIARKL